MKPARLYLWDDRFLWVSHSFKGQMTRRYATNVILSISEKPFLLRLPRNAEKPCRAALCSSRALRCVDATDTPFLSFNLDPGSADARSLEGLADGQAVIPLCRDQLAGIDQDFRALLHGERSAAQARKIGDRIIRALAGPRPPQPPLDPRIQKVLQYLRAQRPTDIDLDTLARLANLSASRLMHLFLQQMGLPMSQFLLWAKMRRAVALMQGTLSLTEVAQACGFADSSHLTRTFKAFYGIKPSVLANSSYVQLIVC
jgi:AraC-like DNA-binding protein